MGLNHGCGSAWPCGTPRLERMAGPAIPWAPAGRKYARLEFPALVPDNRLGPLVLARFREGPRFPNCSKWQPATHYNSVPRGWVAFFLFDEGVSLGGQEVCVFVFGCAPLSGGVASCGAPFARGEVASMEAPAAFGTGPDGASRAHGGTCRGGTGPEGAAPRLPRRLLRVAGGAVFGEFSPLPRC